MTYVEVTATGVTDAIAGLKVYRAASLREASVLDVDLYQETTRTDRLLIDEAWKDFAAYQAHVRSSRLADGLKTWLLAPPDRRPHTDGPGVGARKARGVNDFYAFTHIDVHPPHLARLEAILKPYVEKSRGDEGVLRFEFLQGLPTPGEQLLGAKSKVKDRKNHMTLAEAWESEADFYAHQRSAHAIEFRNRVGPLLGAQYDQRLYKLVK